MPINRSSLAIALLLSTVVSAGCGDSTSAVIQADAIRDPVESAPGSSVSGQADGIYGAELDGNTAITDQPGDSSERNNGPAGNSGVTVAGNRYPFNAAIAEIHGVVDQHYNVEFTLTDGLFTIVESTRDGRSYIYLMPVKASAIFHAQMYNPGGEFAFASYGFTATAVSATEGTGALSGIAFFNDAYVGIDINKTGDVEENERFEVVDGTVVFSGQLPDIQLKFSVALGNGMYAVGDYSGLFDFTNRE